MQKFLHILSISDPQISLNRLGCAKKMTEMRSIAVEGHCVWLGTYAHIYVCVCVRVCVCASL